MIIETLSDQMRATRLDNRLFQRELAELIGVSTSTIENWELKRMRISPKYVQKVKAYVAKAHI